MEDGNLNIMAVAQKEYLSQLNDILVPFLIATFDEIYNKALEESKGDKTLRKFQEFLRDIKSWNQGMIKRHAEEICKSCAYFNELLAAVFVSYVKILSAVRLKAEKQKISIKLPKNEDFIFRIYEENAKYLYKDPHWISQKPSDDEKIDKIREINAVALDTVIKSMVPVQKILEAYIGNQGAAALQDNDSMEVESQIGELSDTEDPDVIDAEDETTEEPKPEEGAEVPTGGELPVPQPEGDVPGAEDLVETKNITVPRPPNPMPFLNANDGDGDDDVLFPNANETRN